MVPDEVGRTLVHDIIYNEIVPAHYPQRISKEAYLETIQRAQTQALTCDFGCTEVGLLIRTGLILLCLL